MAGNKGIVPVSFYKFSAANRTITFSNDYAGLDLAEITYITNIKNGVATVIYDPFDATKGGTLNGLTLTLAFDTTTMADSDPLQIITGFTPVNADPLPVRLVEGSDQKDDTELLNRIADGIDFLNLSLDQAEGIEINTRDKSIRKDFQGAIIPSDSVDVPGQILRAADETYVVDATGYNSVVFHIPPPAQSSLSVTIEVSNDISRQVWYSTGYTYAVSNGGVPIYNAGGTSSTVSIIAPNGYIFSVPNIARFVRMRISSYTNGSITPRATLKTTPAHSVFQGNIPTNVNFSGTAPVAAGAHSGATLSLQSSAGTLSIAGAYNPTFNPPGQNPTLATVMPRPIGMAGREWPYVGAETGIFRHLTLDTRGNIMIGGDTAFRTPNMGNFWEQSQAGTTRGIGGIFSNIVGAQSLTVTDVAQDFGDTQVMLMRQILTELKILNQQFHEMPNLLNQANYAVSDPQEYRNDGDFDAALQ